MKVKIHIDCTPVEVRSMLGLPDVTPLHDVYLDRVKTLLEQGVTPDMVTDLVRSWGSVGGAGMALVQNLMGQVGLGSKAEKPEAKRQPRT